MYDGLETIMLDPMAASGKLTIACDESGLFRAAISQDGVVIVRASGNALVDVLKELNRLCLEITK